MPAVSERQRRFMAAIYALKTGKWHGKRKPTKKLKEAAKNLTTEQAHEFMIKKKAKTFKQILKEQKNDPDLFAAIKDLYPFSPVSMYYYLANKSRNWVASKLLAPFYNVEAREIRGVTTGKPQNFGRLKEERFDDFMTSYTDRTGKAPTRTYAQYNALQYPRESTEYIEEVGVKEDPKEVKENKEKVRRSTQVAVLTALLCVGAGLVWDRKKSKKEDSDMLRTMNKKSEELQRLRSLGMF